MSDHSSAELFGMFFDMLAEDPTPKHVAMAHKLWPRTKGYDFSDCQMCCEESLEKLGLARKGVNPEYPEDGEVWLYGPESAAP